jgi:hypothetical protein
MTREGDLDGLLDGHFSSASGAPAHHFTQACR